MGFARFAVVLLLFIATGTIVQRVKRQWWWRREEFGVPLDLQCSLSPHSTTTASSSPQEQHHRDFLTIAILAAPRPDRSFHVLNTVRSFVSQMGHPSYSPLLSRTRVLIVNHFGERQDPVLHSLRTLFAREMDSGLLEIRNVQDPAATLDRNHFAEQNDLIVR